MQNLSASVRILEMTVGLQNEAIQGWTRPVGFCFIQPRTRFCGEGRAGKGRGKRELCAALLSMFLLAHSFWENGASTSRRQAGRE